MLSIVLFSVIYLKLATSANYTAHITTSSSVPYNFIFYKYDSISSTSGNARLLFQGNDGNFVLYHNGIPQWTTQIAYRGADYVEISRTGDILIKNSQHDIIWQANTDEHNTPPYDLFVNEACAYLMDARNYVLWNQGSDCIAPFPTFSPRPTQEPVKPPTSAPSILTNLPTSLPSVTPTSQPTQSPTHPPTNIPSTTPTFPTSRPSKSPTQSPSKTPSVAPSTPPTIPTQSPTHARSIIEDAFIDDFVFEDLDGFGWLNDATVTSNLYHGPYYQNNAYFELSRWFRCSDFSMISIDYTFLCCKGNDHGYIASYINNVEIERTYCDSTTFISSYPKHSVCRNKYYARSLQNIGNIITSKSDAFYVSFKMYTEHADDAIGVSDIGVYCGDAMSNSPTKEPTQPTVAPTRAPTTDTINPTASPTDAPSSPTITPTAAPSMQTTSPTTLTSHPTSFPTISPTSHPIDPTTFPSNSPTKDPTMSPSKPPTNSPTSQTKYPSVPPTTFPSVSPTTDPTLFPTKLPTPSPTSQTIHPTVSPTIARTIVEDVFTDDLVLSSDGVNGAGWENEDTISANLYHGPYHEAGAYVQFWRGFECSSRSTVSISYTLLCCKDNDHAYVWVYIDGNKIKRTWCDETTWPHTSAYPKYSECDWHYYQKVVTGIGSFITPKNKAFYVGFQPYAMHDNDPVGIGGITVYCNDAATTANPTPEPTETTVNPSQQPSVGPSNVPTKRPSREPSAALAPIVTTLWMEEGKTSDQSPGSTAIVTTVFVLIFLGLVVTTVIVHLKKVDRKPSIAKVKSVDGEGDECKMDTDDEDGDVIHIKAVELQEHRETDSDQDSEELYVPVAEREGHHTLPDMPEIQAITPMEPGQCSPKGDVIHPDMVMQGSAVKTVEEQ